MSFDVSAKALGEVVPGQPLSQLHGRFRQANRRPTFDGADAAIPKLRQDAKHVIRSMKENARQGFWNGATAPLGYKLVEAEKRGTKIKKKLDVDAVEAEYVRLTYKLYLYGDGTSGALGVKEVVKWLNHNGYR